MRTYIHTHIKELNTNEVITFTFADGSTYDIKAIASGKRKITSDTLDKPLYKAPFPTSGYFDLMVTDGNELVSIINGDTVLWGEPTEQTEQTEPTHLTVEGFSTFGGSNAVGVRVYNSKLERTETYIFDKLIEQIENGTITVDVIDGLSEEYTNKLKEAQREPQEEGDDMELHTFEVIITDEFNERIDTKIVEATGFDKAESIAMEEYSIYAYSALATLVSEPTTIDIIKQAIQDEELETTNEPTQAIYLIDGIYISGEFDCGSRGVDHNILLFDGITWKDLLTSGVIIVPETHNYISDEPVEELDRRGYARMPLHSNHIVGFKN